MRQGASGGLENRGDVITRVGVGEQASNRALDVLEFI